MSIELTPKDVADIKNMVARELVECLSGFIDSLNAENLTEKFAQEKKDFSKEECAREVFNAFLVEQAEERDFLVLEWRDYTPP
jgi:hypothetical protein